MQFHSEEDILKHGGTPVTTDVLDQRNQKVYWKECLTCRRVKPFGEYKRDASYREGVREQCNVCESAPILSVSEHTSKLREENLSSWAVRQQRWKDQEDFRNEAARKIGWMHHSDFLSKVSSIRRQQLYVRPGNFIGDLALYKVWDHLLMKENGKFYSAPFDPSKPTFAYLCYMSVGYSPEYSVIHFDERDVPIREELRGWRTVLLRLIRSNVLKEEDVDEVFGKARGVASIPYRRELWKWKHS